MLNFLHICTKNSTEIYSFGRITQIRKGKYVISYKKASFLLINVTSAYKLGEWIRFYGFSQNKIVDVKFSESISGLDLNFYEAYIAQISGL